LLSGLVEKNIALNKEGFFVFVGAGAFLGKYRYNQFYYRPDGAKYLEVTTAGGPYIGIETALGGDYYFKKAPIVLGIDIRPRFFQFVYPYLWDGGINIRYIF
jgi:hypothetical protein